MISTFLIICDLDNILSVDGLKLNMYLQIFHQAEIHKILDLGVDQSRIIFANPCKPASHLRLAAKLQVPLMTFDNETELHKISAYYPEAK